MIAKLQSEPQFDHKSPRISAGTDASRYRNAVICGVKGCNDVFASELIARPDRGAAQARQPGQTGYPQ
jgi:hypothetical protein